MPTVIVNPAAATNGTGSLASPRNTFAGIAWGPGTECLQIEGTTAREMIAPTASGSPSAPISIGVCKAGTGERVRARADAARIDCEGRDHGILLRAGISNVQIDGFEIIGAADAPIQKEAADFEAAGVMVTYCHLHGAERAGMAAPGLRLGGDGNVVASCKIHDVGGAGIVATGARAMIDGNEIWATGLDRFSAGGNLIWVVGDSPIVRRNILRAEEKAGVVGIRISGGAGGSIHGNNITMPQGSDASAGIRMMNSDSVAFGNLVAGGHEGIHLLAAGARAMANIVFLGVVSEVGILARASGALVAHNLVHGLGRGIGISHRADSGVRIHNNLLVALSGGIITGATGATENGNLFWDCGRAHMSEAWAEKALGAADLIADPCFIDPESPALGLQNHTPARNAGVSVFGAVDWYGVPFRGRHIGPWNMPVERMPWRPTPWGSA